MSDKKPAYIENSDIATKPVQMYGWKDGAPVRIASDANGSQIVSDISAETLLDTLVSLTATLQELIGRLAPIAGAMQLQGGHALRVAPISSVSTAVTGSLTTVTNLTNFGTATPAKEVADDMNNLVAVMANSNNATAV